MTGYLDRLNLRPFEKRLVVGVAVVLFVVLNFWFVVPHFSDWRDARDRREKAQKKLRDWQLEVDQLPKYRAAIANLIGSASEVAPEDQYGQFSQAILTQQARSGVAGRGLGRSPSHRTNEFFIEINQGVPIEGSPEQIVDFLYNLGNGDSMIRVRGLDLKPDGPRQKLAGSATLVASYQKSPPKKAAPAPGAAPANAKTATSTAKRP